MDSRPPVVSIVDDDRLFRRSVEFLVQSLGYQVQPFGSAEEYLRSPRPDTASCLILDIRMPGLNGLDLQRTLSGSHLETPIIFITGHGDIPMSVRAMKGGAVEFLTKPFHEQDLLDAISTAIEQDRISRIKKSELTALRDRFESLTPKERKVMAFVVAGLLNKQIAGKLELSEITVKIHRHRVMNKMKAESLAQLVRMSERLGIAIPKY